MWSRQITATLAKQPEDSHVCARHMPCWFEAEQGSFAARSLGLKGPFRVGNCADRAGSKVLTKIDQFMKKSVFFLLAFSAVFTIWAEEETIYDNTDNDQMQYNDTRLESGDQVQFAGSNRVIDDFQFEYYASLTATPSGNEKARVRFYLNDGPVGDNPSATPGTLLYESGLFTIQAGSKTIEITNLSVYVPANAMTWTVEFSGLTPAESAGVLFYDPPAIGSSGDFLWQKETNVWTAVAYDGVTNNLSAIFTAVPAVQIQSLHVQANTATLVVSATQGKYYSLEFKSSADQTGWQAVNIPSVHATGNEVTLTDPTLAGAKLRIYRVVERDTATASVDSPLQRKPVV